MPDSLSAMQICIVPFIIRGERCPQVPYTPREGKMIRDINSAWERLEKAEHERELALREELIRQEKLEQLAARYVISTHSNKLECSENTLTHFLPPPRSMWFGGKY